MQETARETFWKVAIFCAVTVTAAVCWHLVIMPNQARSDFLSCMGDTQYRYTLDNKLTASQACANYDDWIE
jgi:hypothetical protein